MSPATGGGWDTGKIPLEICPDPAAHALPARETTLDEAWEAAEKALPEGWWLRGVWQWADPYEGAYWRAEAENFGPDAIGHEEETGDTPAAALHALAAALGRSGSGGGRG